jgi:hypothetical protein
MGFTEDPDRPTSFTDPERPLRDLGQVIREAGGIERFNALMNPRVARGPTQPPREARRCPRQSAPGGTEPSRLTRRLRRSHGEHDPFTED